jgi:hypothetical protein
MKKTAERQMIDQLTKRLEAVEQRVFGNTEQAQPTPQPEPVYDRVFWFSATGKASCINGKQVMDYSDWVDTWVILSSEDLPKHRHRLVPVEEFEVGKFYACDGQDLDTPFGYSMYLGDDRFITWAATPDYPILIHNQRECDVQLLEVQPVNQ